MGKLMLNGLYEKVEISILVGGDCHQGRKGLLLGEALPCLTTTNGSLRSACFPSCVNA